jgi:hypothetical protein
MFFRKFVHVHFGEIAIIQAFEAHWMRMVIFLKQCIISKKTGMKYIKL